MQRNVEIVAVPTGSFDVLCCYDKIILNLQAMERNCFRRMIFNEVQYFMFNHYLSFLRIYDTVQHFDLNIRENYQIFYNLTLSMRYYSLRWKNQYESALLGI